MTNKAIDELARKRERVLGYLARMRDKVGTAEVALGRGFRNLCFMFADETGESEAMARIRQKHEAAVKALGELNDAVEWMLGD
jgi:hypothetical protein